MIFEDEQMATNPDKSCIRKPVKRGDYAVNKKGLLVTGSEEIHEIWGESRRKYTVGKLCAVQPKYGKKTVAYIVIKRIWRQKLSDITDEQALKEGIRWFQIKHGYKTPKEAYFAYLKSINWAKGRLKDPDVWVIEFKRVRDPL